MEVLEAIKSWKSASKFKPMPVPEKKIQAIFNAARLAPSVDNLQPWRFIVVTDEDLKTQVAAAAASPKRLPDAPIIIVACARLDEAEATVGGYMASYPVDIGMALSHLSLAATSEGLGTSWVFAFNEEKVKTALRVPRDAKVVGLSPLGFPEEHVPSDGRKHLAEILSYNRYE